MPPPWISKPFATIGPAVRRVDVGHLDVPDRLAGACVERDEPRGLRPHGPLAGALEDQHVAVERDAARRDLGADVMLPDQVARARVERLHDAARVREIHRAFVHERGGLVRAAVAHRPDPLELQQLRVVGRDLGERAEARRGVVVAQHEPVVGCGIAQHRVRDRREALARCRRR